MKKSTLIIGVLLVLTVLFIFINYQNRNHQVSAFSCNGVIRIITNNIQYNGIGSSLWNYSIGSYKEEMVYRGPILLFFLLFGSGKKRVFIAWVISIILSYYWSAIHTGYSPLCQSLILIGGMVNAGCIIIMKNKASGMLWAITLHAGANILFIILIYHFYVLV